MNFIDTIKNAGVVGAGGAGFPTHMKLNTTTEWFIVNASECEPMIETDKYLCRTYPNEIVEAAEKVGRHLKAQHVVIALKSHYEEEAAALQEAVRKRKSRVTLYTTRSFFPAGDEFVLVEEVTGKVIPEGGLPLQVGAVMDNVGTVWNIYQALKGIPVTDKHLSVSGEVEKPLVIQAPIGTSVLECVQRANPTLDSFGLILGGPMMGKILTDPEAMRQAVVTKLTGSILVLPRDHYIFQKANQPISQIQKRAKSVCMQCRACTDLCPRHNLGHNIQPHVLMRNIGRESLIESDEEYLKAFGCAVNCSSCGACELFSCPMGLSPRQVNIYLKQRLLEKHLTVERGKDPAVSEEKEIRRIPTGRLTARLGLTKYSKSGKPACAVMEPGCVYIPFSQHIGKKAVPVKLPGEPVVRGELLASADEGGPSANIHSSISGIIQEIDENGAQIRAEE